ncbi:ABC transporter ATP-binding protein [Beijerinckia mobilis]|uniref:ABC transporter ATP-binding protein n=1 Tax=Beijerinckia mobilis TaxID=231434 RepID=UPI00055060CE|nr:nitrate/sulfonate/bicarbonate ABC transporter ATP-binding protein [Beijerinckia mobilis]
MVETRANAFQSSNQSSQAPVQTRPETPKILVEAKNICQSYRTGSGETGPMVLDHVSLTLHEGEIIGLLGRSGSGKSSLLRIISGLVQPAAGSLTYLGEPVTGPVDGVAIVFQSFALFPWLSVLANVELGLRARKVGREEARARALKAIDLIGLDGFESAYPKELSGGMRQRVGFARALVVDPNILLMDEPFSALDVLTAETLRTDLLDLWVESRLPIKSILMVTHNIEEAVLMCNRIVVLSSNPGRISAEIPVTLPHPRNRLDPEFRQLVDKIYALMTKRPEPAPPGREPVQPTHTLAMSLPIISTNTLAGMIEEIAADPYNGSAPLPELADSLQMEIDDLFPVGETLQLLHFAELGDGAIRLTPQGLRFADEEVDVRKQLFGAHLLAHVPLAAHIKAVLDERQNHRARASRFLEELEDYMSDDYAEQTLKSVINWGRYGELFAYDENSATFSLEDPH